MSGLRKIRMWTQFSWRGIGLGVRVEVNKPGMFHDRIVVRVMLGPALIGLAVKDRQR